MSIWGVLGLLLFAAGLGYLAWVSIQSLRQARLLRSRRDRSLPSLVGNAVALQGQVRVDDPLKTAAGIRCLWHRVVVEELSGFGKRGRKWRKVSDQSETAGFKILVDGTPIEVGEPTEVQGTDKRTDSDGGGLFETRSRVTEHWLPIVARATVLGRLDWRREDGFVLARDPAVGLLLSPRPPEDAARIETLKGWAGMVGAAAGTIALIWLCLRFYGA